MDFNFNGSLLDYAHLTNALANKRKEERENLAQSFGKIDDILNRGKRMKQYNENKALYNDVKNYEGVKKMVDEDDAWLNNNEEAVRNADQWIASHTGNITDMSDEDKATLKDYNDLVGQWNERQKALETNKKYLADNAKDYQFKKANYGWMGDPTFDSANEEYIRTGNSNLLTNLMNSWRTAELAKQSNKDSSNTAEKEDELDELASYTLDKIKQLKDKGSKLTSDNVAGLELDVNQAIRKLERAGRVDEARSLRSAWKGTTDLAGGNDQGRRDTYDKKVAKWTEEWNKLPERRRNATPLKEYIANGGKEN